MSDSGCSKGPRCKAAPTSRGARRTGRTLSDEGRGQRSRWVVFNSLLETSQSSRAPDHPACTTPPFWPSPTPVRIPRGSIRRLISAVLLGLPAGADLIHDIDVRAPRDLRGQEPHDPSVPATTPGMTRCRTRSPAQPLRPRRSRDPPPAGASPSGPPWPAAVVIGMTEPLRPLVVPELEVGHVDVEDAVEELQRLDESYRRCCRPAGRPPALDGRDQRFENPRDDVARGDEVDVVAPAPGQVSGTAASLPGSTSATSRRWLIS